MLITVSIVEDSARVRKSFAYILDESPGFTCIGQYASGEEAVVEIPRRPPNVVLMDINLPKMSGVECVRRISELLPGIQVIMLTVYEDTDSIFKSLAAGACGYVLKPVRAEQLIGAIKEVQAGGSPMTSSIARKVVQAFKQSPTTLPGFEKLSEREQHVLEHLAKGYLYKEIAELMGITYATVHTHIRHIYEKLRVCSRAQAVAKFIER